jgi:hypothetical protein
MSNPEFSTSLNHVRNTGWCDLKYFQINPNTCHHFSGFISGGNPYEPNKYIKFIYDGIFSKELCSANQTTLIPVFSLGQYTGKGIFPKYNSLYDFRFVEASNNRLALQIKSLYQVTDWIHSYCISGEQITPKVLEVPIESCVTFDYDTCINGYDSYTGSVQLNVGTSSCYYLNNDWSISSSGGGYNTGINLYKLDDIYNQYQSGGNWINNFKVGEYGICINSNGVLGFKCFFVPSGTFAYLSLISGSKFYSGAFFSEESGLFSKEYCRKVGTGFAYFDGSSYTVNGHNSTGSTYFINQYLSDSCSSLIEILCSGACLLFGDGQFHETGIGYVEISSDGSGGFCEKVLYFNSGDCLFNYCDGVLGNQINFGLRTKELKTSNIVSCDGADFNVVTGLIYYYWNGNAVDERSVSYSIGDNLWMLGFDSPRNVYCTFGVIYANSSLIPSGLKYPTYGPEYSLTDNPIQEYNNYAASLYSPIYCICAISTSKTGFDIANNLSQIGEQLIASTVGCQSGFLNQYNSSTAQFFGQDIIPNNEYYIYLSDTGINVCNQFCQFGTHARGISGEKICTIINRDIFSGYYYDYQFYDDAQSIPNENGDIIVQTAEVTGTIHHNEFSGSIGTPGHEIYNYGEIIGYDQYTDVYYDYYENIYKQLPIFRMRRTPQQLRIINSGNLKCDFTILKLKAVNDGNGGFYHNQYESEYEKPSGDYPKAFSSGNFYITQFFDPIYEWCTGNIQEAIDSIGTTGIISQIEQRTFEAALWGSTSYCAITNYLKIKSDNPEISNLLQTWQDITGNMSFTGDSSFYKKHQCIFAYPNANPGYPRPPAPYENLLWHIEETGMIFDAYWFQPYNQFIYTTGCSPLG